MGRPSFLRVELVSPPPMARALWLGLVQVTSGTQPTAGPVPQPPIHAAGGSGDPDTGAGATGRLWQ